MDEKLVRLVAELEGKINVLISKNIALLDQANSLTNKIHRLEAELDSQKKAMSEAEEQNKIVKIAETLKQSGRSNDELLGMINHYLRELDECIRLIGDSKL